MRSFPGVHKLCSLFCFLFGQTNDFWWGWEGGSEKKEQTSHFSLIKKVTRQKVLRGVGRRQQGMGPCSSHNQERAASW